MDDIDKNIERYIPNKQREILIAFDDMIADMISNKKLNPKVTELFIRGRDLKISLFLLQNLILLRYFKKYKFMILYKKCTAKPYYFLVTDTTRASDNPLRIRENFVERI